MQLQPPPEFYGKLLKQIRNHRKRTQDSKLTQEKLAEQIDVNVSTIRSYEKGWTVPSPHVVIKLARALDVDTINFFQPSVIDKFIKGRRIYVGSDDVESSIPLLDAALTERLRSLPQMHAGVRVRFKFRNKNRKVDGWWHRWSRLGVSTAKWLELTPGATVYSTLELFTDDEPDGHRIACRLRHGRQGGDPPRPRQRRRSRGAWRVDPCRGHRLAAILRRRRREQGIRRAQWLCGGRGHRALSVPGRG